jgi:hypothetical protein
MPHKEYPSLLHREAPVGSVDHGRALLDELELEADHMAELTGAVESEMDIEELRQLVYAYSDNRDSMRRIRRRLMQHIENVHERAERAESVLERIRACRRDN